MIFYYVRHGDPIYDPDSLTELGHKQAAALAKRFSLYGLDEIYCSTSNRAKLTAEPTCKALGKGKTLLDWTNEGHTFEGMSVRLEDGSRTWNFFLKDYLAKYNSPEVRALGDEWYTHPYFKDTNFAAEMQRIHRKTDAFMLSLGYRHDRKNHSYEVLANNDKKVALFAHAGFGLSFLSSLLDIPYPSYCSHFDIEHSGVTVIALDSKAGEITYPKVLQHSNDSHLYKEDLMTGYNNTIFV